MRKIVLMLIASLWICSNVNSQELTNNQKVKITSEITELFEIMDGFNEAIKGCKSQKWSISNKKITILSDNVALLTAFGNYSVAPQDGRTLTGRRLLLE